MIETFLAILFRIEQYFYNNAKEKFLSHLQYLYFCVTMKILFLQDADSIPLSKKERILYFLLLIFFFAIYMPGITWLYNVLMWMFFAYSFFFNSLKDKWAILKNRKEIMLIVVFFLLNLGSALLSANQKEGISFAGIRISLWAISIAIGTIYIKPILKERLIFAFAVATAVAAAGVLLWGIGQSTKYSDLSLLYNDNLSNIINLQSIYFAMLINLAIFSFVYLLTKKSSLINNNAIVPVLFILFIVHFLLASRIAIIMLYGSIFIFAIVYIVSKKKILEGMTLILGLLLGSFLLVKFFPKTINRFKELGYTKFDFKSTAKESHYNVALTPDQWNGANIRIAVWECAWQVIKANMVFGTGLGDKGDELKKAYLKKEFTFGYTTNRNTHNNYVDVWMSLGLIVFLLFLTSFFILPLFHCIKASDWYGLTVIISFMLSLLTENYMDRTMGNTLLAFFIVFIVSYKKPKGYVGYTLSAR